MADFWKDLRVNSEKFGRWARDWVNQGLVQQSLVKMDSVKQGLVKMDSVRALVKEWMGRIF